MPSAFHATREFARRSLAEIRSGQGDSAPHQHVEPFGAGQASTGAALLKLATTASNVRRDRAAAQRDLADKELARELVRAQIAEIRAKTTAAGQPAATKTGPVTGQDFTVGGKTYPAGTSRGDVSMARGLANDAEHRNVAGKTTAAKAAIGQLDQRIEQEVPIHVARTVAAYGPYIAALTGPDNPTPMAKHGLRTDSVRVLRAATGIDFSPYTQGAFDLTPREKLSYQQAALEHLKDWAKNRARNILRQNTIGERQRHQQVIDEMSQRTIPSDVGDASSSDPEGLFAPEGP